MEQTFVRCRQRVVNGANICKMQTNMKKAEFEIIKL